MTPNLSTNIAKVRGFGGQIIEQSVSFCAQRSSVLGKQTSGKENKHRLLVMRQIRQHGIVYGNISSQCQGREDKGKGKGKGIEPHVGFDERRPSCIQWASEGSKYRIAELL